MLVIGLMSGTSADGIDAALVEWPDDEATGPFRLLAHAEQSHSSALRGRIHALAAAPLEGKVESEEYAVLGRELAEHFADVAIASAQLAGVALGDIDAIASHGQTVGHYPDQGITLQIGDAQVIAKRTGCTTVANFRPRDIALGGQGAPLAPFFHWAAFGATDETRVALNLGGIANISWLPGTGNPDQVLAFDTGPANSLMDGVVSIVTIGHESYDRDGARAKRGCVDDALLAQLLDDDYLTLPPPKSTGRERYGTAQAEALVEASRACGRSEDDLIATLVAFTAQSVADACRVLLPAQDANAKRIDRLVVGGGGAANPAILDALRARLPGVAVDRFDQHGVPIQAAEAMAFSLMGRNALLGLPNHLPRCTGARSAGVLGEITRP